MPLPSHLGLIAGNGRFPILFAQQAKRRKIKVTAVGIKGDTSRWLKFFVDELCWVSAGELEKLFGFFRAQAVNKVIMAGQVNPKNLFDERVALDKEFARLFSAVKDRKADTIFKAVADLLKTNGMELLDSTFLLTEYLAPKGTLTQRGPSLQELADIEFGREIARVMGALDIGQTVVVKEKAILAIEAMEGTDRTILRGGQIARKGAVVVKMSKPSQDQRFDIPVIGMRTIQFMVKAKASCIAVEAGKTLLIDRPKCVRLANQGGICIVGA